MAITRRNFIITGAAALAGCARATVLPARKASLRLGYAAITWGNNDLLAIQEISEVGYVGIQLRANVVNAFVRHPPTLTNLLAEKRLTFVALSSGALAVDSSDEPRMLADHLMRARFLRDAGGLFLQVTDQRPRERKVSDADLAKLSELLNGLGQRVSEVGVTLVYHPHMGTMGERPEDTERILAATDPNYVKLLLDVAHYKQGGGDPAAAVRRYRSRLALLHLKDVQPLTQSPGYRFVELGRGTVDLDAVFSALNEVAFNGWAVVELDAPTEIGRTPRQSAEMNRAFLTARGHLVGAAK